MNTKMINTQFIITSNHNGQQVTPPVTQPTQAQQAAARFTTDLAQILSDVTRVWFGPSDVLNAFWLAMRTTGAKGWIVTHSHEAGLSIRPGRADVISQELAVALREISDNCAIAGDDVAQALRTAMRLHFGYQTGVMMIALQPRGVRITLGKRASNQQKAVRNGSR